MMDKLTGTTVFFFVVSLTLAVTAISTADWIVSNIPGNPRIGILFSCLTVHGWKEKCQVNRRLPGAWIVALIVMICGCLATVATIAFMIYSHWRRGAVVFAKWTGLGAVILSSLATIIFPIGFSVPDIGGAAYQLPNSYEVGISYILFVMSLWMAVISEMFAFRIRSDRNAAAPNVGLPRAPHLQDLEIPQHVWEAAVICVVMGFFWFIYFSANVIDHEFMIGWAPKDKPGILFLGGQR